jgi:hypothetical protein
MRRGLRLIGTLTLLGSATLGCHKSSVEQKVPPDPLLISKKPIEGQPHPDLKDLPQRPDPLPPPPPQNRDTAFAPTQPAITTTSHYPDAPYDTMPARLTAPLVTVRPGQP